MFVRHTGTTELRRTAAACLALFQVGSTSALTHADALLDARSMGSPVHVESPDASDCAIHHDHLFCQVVRSLSQATFSCQATTAAAPTPPILIVEAGPEAHEAKCAPILRGPVVPRGPPVS